MFKEITNQKQWDSLVNESAYNHPLQLWGWGELKKINGWLPLRLKADNGFAAQILLKKIPKLKLYLAYCPRGPLCQPVVFSESILELKKYLKKYNVISLRIEPSYFAKEASILNLQQAKNKVLMNETLQINLTYEIEEIRSSMSSSTKNNINKSLKNIEVINYKKIKNFIDQFYVIYSDTANRSKFKIQTKSYYKAIIDNMNDNLDIKVAIDRESGKMISFLWNAFSKDVTVELYAGMDQSYAKAKSNYGIKFKAIEDAKLRGNKIYDFGGRLKGGVESFKLSFGPKKVNYTKTLQLNLNPFALIIDLAEGIARKY